MIFGFLTGLLGLLIILTPFGLNLEENLGLDLLFKLRGVRQAPPEVIVVSIDKLSSDKLNLPNDPVKWPRSLHAQLIENLTNEGASVIAFDLFFNEARSAEDDNLFANVMNKTGNVVLSEYLVKNVPFDESGNVIKNLHIVKRVPPIPSLAKSAAAVACFPLPKVPFNVRQYWTFKRVAGDIPTLPVVMLQSFSLEVYDELIRLLEKYIPNQIDNIPQDKELIINSKSIKNVVIALRHIFEREPSISKRMLEDLQDSKTPFTDPRKKQLLKSLIMMYQSPNSQYLNLYGPPRTIATIPYYQALQLRENTSVNQRQLNFNQKAVFVGLSENIQSGKKTDGYNTVYSQSSGVDISGVEIAATAFANLLEDMPVQQVSINAQLFTIFLFGLIMGIFCRPLPVIISALNAIGISLLYLIAVFYQFKTSGIWYPLMVPLLFQMPFAFCGGLLCKYIESNKERKNIKKAFQYYLPGDMVDQISKSVKDIKTSSQTVYGTCLSTDAEDYTSLSESLDPDQVKSVLNKYYECIFEPVKQRNGIVSNIIGDSMLAIWVTAYPDEDSKKQACHAALDIVQAVHRFNQSNTLQLPTRIGLHSGNILLGNIGAIDHYEYRPVGDIINTVTRIDGLNKYLNTQIVLTGDILNQLNGFLTRDLGKFLLAGKSKPIAVHELICRTEESNQLKKSLCLSFSDALNAFKGQSWAEAIERFEELIRIFGDDGPSLFYLKLCQQYREKHAEKSWDGVVCMGKK
jgi:adenylate cyclase